MKVYAASRRDLAYAIQSYNDNDSITFISTAKVQIKNVSCKYFGNYYTNQKARPLNNKMANADTLDGAGVNSGNALDAAKVQKNFETAKDLAKKNCLLSYHSALIAGASVKAAHGAALSLFQRALFKPFHQNCHGQLLCAWWWSTATALHLVFLRCGIGPRLDKLFVILTWVISIDQVLL